MLEEDTRVKQISGEPRRRWFFDENIDLIVWFHDVGSILGFQLCYDKQDDEHAFSWREDKGYFHNHVDPGEPGPLKNLSPILVSDGMLDVDKLKDEFEQNSVEIDLGISSFVLEKLDDYQAGDVPG
ncbi:MAG: hypothetical protein FVQ83_09680 [Chloroflexi bacterium]|nr:hypothetical protein [Chloroflexota bacterium]